MKSFWKNLVSIVLALVLGGCTLTALRNRPLTPTASRQANATLPPPTANRNPILTSILAPAEGSSFSPDSTIPVNVSFDSQVPVQLVQVYLDGQAVDSIQPDPQAQVTSLSIPGAFLQGEGLHTLMVMTYDSFGRAALSNTVHLTGVPASPVAYTLTVKMGDTLQAFADRLQVNLDGLMAANPGLGESAGITGGTQVLRADTVLLVPLGGSPTAQPFSGKAPGEINYAAGIPIPPSTTVQVGGCDVQVIVAGQEGQPSGYTLYRLDPDSTRFVAIAFAPPGGDGGVVFADENLFGQTQYLVSAYNEKGETFSPPVVAKPTDPGCNLAQATLPVSDGLITLPADAEAVYFYISINAGEYDRWPAKQGEFLTPSEGVINLLQLMKSRPDLKLTYPLYVNLEAWGWKAGELLYLGGAYSWLEEADLKICRLGPSCSGEASVHFGYTASIDDEKNASRELKWLTSQPGIDTALFQLSTHPFPEGYLPMPPGLVYSQLLSGSDGGGYFVVDFANLPMVIQGDLPGNEIAPPQPTGTPLGPQIISNATDWLLSRLQTNGLSQWWPMDLDPNRIPGSLLPVENKFYARIIPMSGGQPAGPISNTVVVDYNLTGPKPTLVLETVPLIFDLHLETDQFTPPIPPDPNVGWGCVDVLAVDPHAMAWTDPEGPWQYAYGIWLHAYETKTPICPVPWDPDANKSPLEKLWDYIGDGIGYVNQAYHYAKDAVIGPFEAGMQLLSLGNCGTHCHQWLHVGLDIVLAAYGIPPEVPDLNKLTDQGIQALVEEGLEEFELDGACDLIPKCREELTKMLMDMKNVFNMKMTSSYQDEDIAHAHGVKPLAIPYGGAVTVRPSLRGQWQLPAAVVTITRKPGTGNAADIASLYPNDYWLDVWIHAQNQTCVGQKHSYSTASCTINGGVAYGCQDVVETLDEPCEGTLFLGRILVPFLQPGESRQVKVILLPQPYYLPVPAQYEVYQSISSNDYPYLYVGAETTIQATIIGTVQKGPWPFEMSVAADGPYPLTLPEVFGGYH